MANDPLQLTDLQTMLGFLVGDAGQATSANTLYIINRAYTLLASIKGYWRMRSFDYTGVSSPALADGTYQYAVPSASGSVYDTVFRVYYRRAGRFIDIPVVDDDDWLIRSRIQATDKGDPRYCRIVQTASQKQLEFSPRTSGNFITTIGTITMEYFIQIVQLVNPSDEPILPANLRHHIVSVAGHYYAIAQGDTTLIASLAVQAKEAYLACLKHDLTRTGRPRQLRPKRGYEPVRVGTADAPYYDYGGPYQGV